MNQIIVENLFKTHLKEIGAIAEYAFENPITKRERADLAVRITDLIQTPIAMMIATQSLIDDDDYVWFSKLLENFSQTAWKLRSQVRETETID